MDLNDRLAGPQQRRARRYTLAAPVGGSDIPSLQTRIHAAQRSSFQKVDDVLGSMGFCSLGEFLAVLFYCHPSKSKDDDLRTPQHQSTVTTFLQGDSKIHMGHIIPLIYNHHQSQPTSQLKHAHDAHLAFSPTISLTDIHHARPSLSTWAT
jgi:hypothetical protein